MNPHVAARRMITLFKAEEDEGRQSETGYDQPHLLWMLHSLSRGDVLNDKAHRWLGWAQCLAVALGLTTLAAMKDLNHAS